MEMLLLIYVYYLHLLGCVRLKSCLLVAWFHYSAFLLLTPVEVPVPTKPLLEIRATQGGLRRIIKPSWFVILSRRKARVLLSFLYRQSQTKQWHFLYFCDCTYLYLFFSTDLQEWYLQIQGFSKNNSTDYILAVPNVPQEGNLSRKNYPSVAKP